MALRTISARSSITKSGAFSGLRPIATTISSNIERARRRTSRWPNVMGSNDPV
jgi:hypothetical protein